MAKFNDLLDTGRLDEAKATQRILPPIGDTEVSSDKVEMINRRTVLLPNYPLTKSQLATTKLTLRGVRKLEKLTHDL